MGRIFALTYDRSMARIEKAGFRELRERALARAAGDVLEVGGGTGGNLPYYGPAATSLTIAEPEAPMLKRLERRVREQGSPATVVRAAAEDLPFADDAFDTVVSTLVLCGVRDQRQSLREIRRVLRPGGRLVFVEHVRSDDPKLARTQDRLNRLHRFVARCECNRATLDAIRGEGFEVEALERTMLNGVPRIVRPAIVGAATVPA
ncbi:MAG TPA: class I SAM-dependent methyltransferase [Gaiellaceae bacterium]|nr:class I SAM-dependent methyltransferase [Gaiellaceae bacterium]